MCVRPKPDRGSPERESRGSRRYGRDFFIDYCSTWAGGDLDWKSKRGEGMSGTNSSATAWILWPFAAVWRLLATILVITGRVLGIILALGLMAVGVALTITVAGAPVGIPVAILGFLLMIRSVF